MITPCNSPNQSPEILRIALDEAFADLSPFTQEKVPTPRVIEAPPGILSHLKPREPLLPPLDIKYADKKV
jgi:hypothetical protein